MGKKKPLVCTVCGAAALVLDDDLGQYSCQNCSTLSQDYSKEFAEDDMMMNTRHSAVSQIKRRKLEELKASVENYFDAFQRILIMQSDALIASFGVSPMQKVMLRKIWFRYLEATRQEAAEAGGPRFFKRMRLAASEREIQMQLSSAEHRDHGPGSSVSQSRFSPLTGKRVLDSTYTTRYGHEDITEITDEGKLRIERYGLILLRCSLALQLLACAMIREPILPCELLNWTFKGHVPFLNLGTKFQAFKNCNPNFQESAVPSQFFLEQAQLRILQKMEMADEYPAQQWNVMLQRVIFRLGLPREMAVWGGIALQIMGDKLSFRLRHRTDVQPCNTALLTGVVMLLLKLTYRMDRTPARPSCLPPDGKERVTDDAAVLPEYDELLEVMAHSCGQVYCFEDGCDDAEEDANRRKFAAYISRCRKTILTRHRAMFSRGQPLADMFSQLSRAAGSSDLQQAPGSELAEGTPSWRTYRTSNKEALEAASNFVMYQKSGTLINAETHPRIKELAEVCARSIGLRVYEVELAMQKVEKAFKISMSEALTKDWHTLRHAKEEADETE